MYVRKLVLTFFIFSLLFIHPISSQEIDYEEFIERIERLEKNVSDLQKGKLGEIEKNLPAGYISRNESRFDKIETKNRLNYGILEEIQNKIQVLEGKVDLINKDFQSRIIKIENKIKDLTENKNLTRTDLEKKPLQTKNSDEKVNLKKIPRQEESNVNLNESQLKKKYENAIKLLWASKFDEAKKELLELKNYNPEDLMPNIQYWLGEVFYAQKDFSQAVIEFGEGLKKYPDSIKGPDNMLKLGLSFSNLGKKDDACNVLYELEIKYKDAPKNVLEISTSERKKIKLPKRIE